MNPILIVREEIVCLVILVFILLYSSIYKLGKDQGSFKRICVFAIGHVIFDLITVLTVNNLDTVPSFINKLCHIVFYMFALLFSYELLCYIFSIGFSKRIVRVVQKVAIAPVIAYLIAVPFLPMEYLSGNGSNYSYGTAAIVGYGVAMLLFVVSILIIAIFNNKFDSYALRALMPMLIAAIAAEVTQILVPELLFTGGAVTIITVGFFFSLENQAIVLSQKVLTDAMTGVKSRHSYEADIETMEKEFLNGTKFGLVFCDINDLKAVNDRCGHLEGDAYIGCIAQIIMSSLKSADAIYRMGGDEFLAVYRGRLVDVMRKEIACVRTACENESGKHDYEVSLAVGYAVSSPDYGSIRNVLRMADYHMYSDKAKTKQKRAFLMSGNRNINISGLTDRIFDAFAGTDSNRFLFVTNMTTNVTRWSHSAVEYFGFTSEFIYNCSYVLHERVHADDKNSFYDDIRAVFAGNQKYHDLEYRIKNGSGNYVVASSTGTVLKGRNSEPDLFAGTMLIHSSEESIDHLTELRNGYEMMNYFNYLIRTHTQAALLNLSILNLSRINMLYGHVNGSEIIRQFASAIRTIAGDSGSVFRTDGTKFVICMPDMKRDGIKELNSKIRMAAEREIRTDTLTPPLQLAAGAFMLESDFIGTAAVIRSNLIYAHDNSKYENRGKLVFYETTSLSAQKNSHKNQLVAIHQDAIAGFEGFYIVYQSVISAKTQRVVGAEALIRWENSSFGTVGPDSFIPWLENDPCFIGLGNWILRRALTDSKSILDYIPDFTININISMSQLEHESFRFAVIGILEETGFPPSHLCLELTERCRELNSAFLKEEIEFFRGHGIRVALDDLGTGFSSFGLLLNLNVDEIKLDRTFVKEIREKRTNQILTGMIIDVSKKMGYSTCLEGIEDDDLRQYVDHYGATYYQGFYCDRPARIDNFISHIRSWNDKHPE